jgi:hypothetical protein
LGLALLSFIFLATVWILRPAANAGRVAMSVPAPGESDGDLYAAIVRDQQSGDSYYEAVGKELRTRGYPTRPVFNWRPPLLLKSLALISPSVGRWLLLALAVGLLVITGLRTRWDIVGIVAMTNIVALMAPQAAVYFSEAWAGVLIGLSLHFYMRERFEAGAVLGLLALFFRELSAPYCVLCTLLSFRYRRRRELAIWIAGAVGYAVYFGLHVWSATAHFQSTDRTHLNSWMYFGGLPFLLHVWQFNGLLLAAPTWAFAAVVVAWVLAVAAPGVPVHLRLTVLVYAVCFLFVGQPFDDYWGFLVAPSNALLIIYMEKGLSEWWSPRQGRRALVAPSAQGSGDNGLGPTAQPDDATALQRGATEPQLPRRPESPSS